MSDDATLPTADLLACGDLSVEHADGTTECLDLACELPHALHTFQASCEELGRCGCAAALAAVDAA